MRLDIKMNGFLNETSAILEIKSSNTTIIEEYDHLFDWNQYKEIIGNICNVALKIYHSAPDNIKKNIENKLKGIYE